MNNGSYREPIELLQDYEHGAGEDWRPKLFLSVWEKQRQMWSFHKPPNRLLGFKALHYSCLMSLGDAFAKCIHDMKDVLGV